MNEAGGAWVRSLVRAKAGHRIYVARIAAVEVASAITRRQHAGDLSPAQAGAIIGHFRRHLTQRCRVIESTISHFDDAMLAARRHRLRACDAVQLVVALGLHRPHRVTGTGPLTLVSADRDLSAAAASEGLAVEDPNAHP